MSHEPDCTNSLSYKIIEMSCKKTKIKHPKKKLKIKNDSFFQISRVANDSFIDDSLIKYNFIFSHLLEMKMKTEAEFELV